MKWTHTYPTEPGVYWMKAPRQKPQLIIVDKTYNSTYYYHYNYVVDWYGVEVAHKTDNAITGYIYRSVREVSQMNQPGILFSDSTVVPPEGTL